MGPIRRKLAKVFSAESLGFRSLRQRLSLMPVAAVLVVSLIAHFFVHHEARDELYQSREQLARGLADNVAQHLSGQLSEVRDELSSWATHLAALSQQGAPMQATFQNWLRGLGDPARSRYDIITLVDPDNRVVAINEMGLSVPMLTRLSTPRYLGGDIGQIVGESDGAWIRPTRHEGVASGLPWRSISVVNRLYSRGDPRTRDDVVRSHQIVFAVPVLLGDGTTTNGALVAVASWAPFQRIIDEAEAYMNGIGLRTGYGFVFDTQGDHIIGHKFREPSPGQNLLDRSVGKDYNLPHLTAAAAAATGHAFEYNFPPGNRKFAVFRAVEPATKSPSYAFDWRLGIGVDYSDIFAPLARLRDAVILATLAVALAVAIVGVWLGRTLSLSVKEFTHLVTQAADGRFDLISRSASHDEISDLSDAMNRLFVSMRERTEVEAVPNPYVVGTPVRSATMFYGRQEDLRWIADRLRQPGNDLIMLYGQRRIGKTSLLHQIRNVREWPTVLPVFVDTHALLPILRCDDDFYAGIGRTISRELAATRGNDACECGRTADDLVAMMHSLNMQYPIRRSCCCSTKSKRST